MINAKEVIEIIGKVAPSFDLKVLDKDEKLEDQGLDSLDIMSTFFEIEERYKIKINEDDIEKGKLSSINSIVEYVNAMIKIT